METRLTAFIHSPDTFKLTVIIDIETEAQLEALKRDCVEGTLIRFVAVFGSLISAAGFVKVVDHKYHAITENQFYALRA